MVKELKLPGDQRSDYMKRIESLIRYEFDDVDLEQKEFAEAMWLVMMMLCGPEQAAAVIRETQIHQ